LDIFNLILDLFAVRCASRFEHFSEGHGNARDKEVQCGQISLFFNRPAGTSNKAANESDDWTC
jgi:hypothetical protein